MANYRKSFNFRSGVQVDNDNFVVTPLGLVGIGTTVPTELLDVRGTVTVTGLVTTSDLYVSGITTLDQLTAGIVTGSYFYGDGSNLTNIPTSQWTDTDVGLGYTSIYAAGNVGIASTDPRHTLQVGSDPTVSGRYGVGISSSGNIYSSGIVTASSFVGDGSQLTGIGVTVDVRTNSFVVSGVSTIAVTSATDLTTQQLSVSGLSTFTGNIDANGDLDVDGHTELDQLNVSGIATAFDLDVDGHAELDQLNVSGISTFVGNVDANGDLDVDGRTELDITNISETLNVAGVSTFTGNIDANGDLDVDGHTELDQLNVSGVSTFVENVNIGSGNTSVVLRFGDTENTFDIINNDTGNINMYLHNGDVGVGTGRFDWVYGQTNQELMSLNYDGKLGLGKTDPDNTLHVVGTSTVTGNAWFGGDVTVSGTLNTDSITLPSIITSSNILSSSGVSTFFDISVTNNISVASSIGIGTSTPIVSIDAQNSSALFANVGINTDIEPEVPLKVTGQSIFDSVGIGTTLSNGEGILNYNSYVQRNSTLTVYSGTIYGKEGASIGIGTTATRSAVDFADAGKDIGSGEYSFMLIPRLTESQKTGLTTALGAMIYNLDSNKFQGWNGSVWNNFH